MKNIKGFTLIELLAVIIILGILMIIAIPSVTKYISDSRKSAYIDTAKEIIGGARNIVNGGKLEMYATDTTYYIPTACIKTENASKSPYGDFTKAYIGVIYDGKGYKYYWISVDDAGQGVSKITPLDKLDTDSIESDLKDSDIESVVTTTGIGNRTEIKILNCNPSTNVNSWEREYHLDNISGNVPEEGSASSSENTQSNIVCKPATVLHTGTCTATAESCYTAGYYPLATYNTSTITYGTIPNGSPKPGDAYDCKVSITGDYTERFYYVTSEGDNSILLYSKNVGEKVYDTVNENWHGPRNGYQYLPSISEWNNPNIIAPGTRQIVNENGQASTSGGTINNFTYTNKAARLLTYQEVLSACGSSNVNLDGYLDDCNWMMDGISYYENHSGDLGYWLETPVSNNTGYVYLISGRWRNIGSISADYAHYSVRPVITVKTTTLGIN